MKETSGFRWKIERSSLGTRAARQLRARTTDATAAKILARAQHAGRKNPHSGKG